MTTLERVVPVPRALPTARNARLPRPGRALRHLLVGLDMASIAVGWSIPFVSFDLLSGTGRFVAAAYLAGLILVTMAAVAAQQLYLARVCTVRAVEITRLGRASAAGAIGGLIAPAIGGFSVNGATAVLGATSSFLLLVISRAAFRNWLQTRRRHGGHTRPVVVIGTNEEGAELVHLLVTHPELGFNVVGVVGDPTGDAALDGEAPYLAPVSNAAAAVEHSGATGVLIAASSVAPHETNRLVRLFTRHGVHVHLSTGLRGIASHRMRSAPLAHEPLFYVEPLSLARWQFVVKRILDGVLGVISLVVFAPVLLVAAIAIKLDDRGPVLFRQTRIGHHGVPFTVLKLRTMRPDAEHLLPEIREINQRDGGPLFKAVADPRRTKVGAWLERFSIDELPQLVNVLRGEMSLVGPRPALPEEVAEFDEELRTRHAVLPGITGLWQVEARDNPSFSAYRRYDLFYIENWSVQLDLAILVATGQRVLFRSLAAMTRRRRPADEALAAA